MPDLILLHSKNPVTPTTEFTQAVSREAVYYAVARADAALGKASKRGRHLIDSILKYFEGFERAARLANHRTEYQHFEQCWLTVHEAFYGEFRIAYPAAVLCRQLATKLEGPEKPETKPKWFVNKFNRPMRRVTGIKKVHGQTFLVLGCGHLKDCFEQDTRKHARCEKCRGK